MKRLKGKIKKILGGGGKQPPYRGYDALQFILRNYAFESVLDIGCGNGIHSDIFMHHGKKVTAIDYGESIYFKKNKHNTNFKTIIDDFNTFLFEEQYDCVWCCHVLEHQENTGDFLKKLNSILKEGGILAITVPPLKDTIVGGHVSLWNAGLLLYRLVLAGFDCAEASVKTYGYNISVVVKKRSINVRHLLTYDCGDLKAIVKYLPRNLNYLSNPDDMPFEGTIQELNWK